MLYFELTIGPENRPLYKLDMNITFWEILAMIATFFGALVVFSITVFVHEWGHFLAARKMGLYVDRFAIGFGPTLFSFKRNGVEYCFKSIPFGGFVSLPQMAPMETVEGKTSEVPKDLPPGTPWQKIVTAFSGPLASFTLALVMACVVFAVGKHRNALWKTTIIGYVEPGTPAAGAGLLPGDRLLRINGDAVDNWREGSHSVAQSIFLSHSKTIKLEVDRDGKAMTFQVVSIPDPKFENLPKLGFEDFYYHPLIIKQVFDGSPAQVAGLQKGDKILSLNGQKTYSGMHFSNLLAETKQQPVTISYFRDGVEKSVTLEPKLELITKEKRIGIGWDLDFIELYYPTPVEQVKDAVINMWKTLSALVAPGSGVKAQHLSGPIGIFNVIMKLLQQDFRALLWFMVFLNVNLAIMNLLPIPILDGGHIVFSILEAVQRKPINIKILETVMTSSFVLIIFFFLFVSYFDVGRVFKGNKDSNTGPKNQSLEQKFEK
jgi:regulator of sigma E protease